MKNLFRCRTGLFIFLFLSLSFTTVFAQTKAIPQRSDIAEKYKWRLEDIYPTTEDWEKDFSKLKEITPQISACKGHLSDSGKKLLQCLALNDTLSDKLDRLYVYANLKLDEDTRNSTSQQMADRISSLGTQVAEAASFFQPEILAISDQKVKDFIRKEKGLKT